MHSRKPARKSPSAFQHNAPQKTPALAAAAAAVAACEKNNPQTCRIQQRENLQHTTRMHPLRSTCLAHSLKFQGTLRYSVVTAQEHVHMCACVYVWECMWILPDGTKWRTLFASIISFSTHNHPVVLTLMRARSPLLRSPLSPLLSLLLPLSLPLSLSLYLCFSLSHSSDIFSESALPCLLWAVSLGS